MTEQLPQIDPKILEKIDNLNSFLQKNTHSVTQMALGYEKFKEVLMDLEKRISILEEKQ